MFLELKYCATAPTSKLAVRFDWFFTCASITTLKECVQQSYVDHPGRRTTKSKSDLLLPPECLNVVNYKVNSMIILWNSSRNYSNRVCKRRSQWLSLTLKDHNSTLLLVLIFAGTINWCLWVIVEVCGNVSAVRQDLWEDPSWFKWFKMFAWKTWEVFSRASHLGYISQLSETEMAVDTSSLGSRLHHNMFLCQGFFGHTVKVIPFDIIRTGHSEATLVKSRFVRSTVSRHKQVNFLQRIPNITQLSPNHSQLESIAVCIFIFGQLLLAERVHTICAAAQSLRFGLVSLVCPHVVQY